MRFKKTNPLVYDRLEKGKEIHQINNFDRFVKMIDAVAVSYCTNFMDCDCFKAIKVMNLKTGHRSLDVKKLPRMAYFALRLKFSPFLSFLS